jgi:hypothetical protein
MITSTTASSMAVNAVRIPVASPCG